MALTGNAFYFGCCFGSMLWLMSGGNGRRTAVFLKGGTNVVAPLRQEGRLSREAPSSIPRQPAGRRAVK
ncbi:hypothetical protein chiPu_0010768 [Chiloscyllium punctatum]|uniref:Uncharacterized protein n=1 Tax=Chiloscyllium punctatum TaxID=137246 RepID=A0A401SPI8_CHIPU|nr:hypothetical protein [Chiloscyllium punctatum]